MTEHIGYTFFFPLSRGVVRRRRDGVCFAPKANATGGICSCAVQPHPTLPLLVGYRNLLAVIQNRALYRRLVLTEGRPVLLGRAVQPRHSDARLAHQHRHLTTVMDLVLNQRPQSEPTLPLLAVHVDL